jgi:hypothetical protein
MTSIKIKSMIISYLNRGMLPRDAMDQAQRDTRKDYSRDELRDAAEAAIEKVKASGKTFDWMQYL